MEGVGSPEVVRHLTQTETKLLNCSFFLCTLKKKKGGGGGVGGGVELSADSALPMEQMLRIILDFKWRRVSQVERICHEGFDLSGR